MLHPRGKVWVRVSCPFPSPMGTTPSTPTWPTFQAQGGPADKGPMEGGLKAAIPGLSVAPHPRLSLLGGGSLEGLRPRLLCALTRSLSVRCFAPSRYSYGPLGLLRPLLSPEPV